MRSTPTNPTDMMDQESIINRSQLSFYFFEVFIVQSIRVILEAAMEVGDAFPSIKVLMVTDGRGWDIDIISDPTLRGSSVGLRHWDLTQ